MTTSDVLLGSVAERMAAATKNAQQTICRALEEEEGAPFKEIPWTPPGDGTSYLDMIIEDGRVFERASVNHAVMRGPLTPQMAQAATGGRLVPSAGDMHYYATGVSVVVHPRNPMVPSTHANYRYFEIEDRATGSPPLWWFGGGSDLTPYYLFDEDATHFHRTYKAACDTLDASLYGSLKPRCDEYFRIPHRNESRGIGGIFFDQMHDRPASELLDFVQTCMAAFVTAYLPIVKRRGTMPYDDAHRDWQQLRRGRYAEFNLVCDRGTAFGLRMGGPAESILMSLPPRVRWERETPLGPGSDEYRLIEVLRRPRDWA